MWESLRSRRVVIAIGAFALSATVTTFMEGADAPTAHGPISSVAMQSAGASQAALASATGGIGRFWTRHMYLVGVEEENQRLREERDRLREERTRLLSIMQENARLRAMVGFAESHPQYQLAPARVIARDTNEFFRVIHIRVDTGTLRVRPGMPVVSSAGLVGHIESVDGRYAQVLLTVDKRSSVDIVVQRNRARGILEGQGHARDYHARVAYLLRRDEVRVGDILVTSGVGGETPADLVVGFISEVNDRNYGLYQEVVVAPSVDFSRLEEVWILVGEGRETP